MTAYSVRIGWVTVFHLAEQKICCATGIMRWILSIGPDRSCVKN